ncbi:hypothetical protein BU16DRAFT_543339 [Lophium mytilinum]|uniref:Type 1 phosphatases regulator n=1 Tax=Lophium mytilinum TaxID=390894 RepID=A0A6A6QFA0_9PEZI|nr:hypothetical protein BU16DRAFT_543339 [Lophium mytilinum]
MATSMASAQNTGTPATTTVQTPVLRLRLPVGTLHLRAEPAEERHIQWAEDVIDNEGMGKKSSKVCCQYHKPRPYDESSDESSDSSDSDSDSEPDNSNARPVGGRRGGGRPQGRKPHDHHDHDHDHDGEGSGGNPPKHSQAPSRKRAPNAYDKAPKKR